MRHITFLLIFLISSCSKLSKHTTKNQKELIISLEKTACFGTCPVYKIKIYNSGKATYEGLKHVEKTGLHYLTISESEKNKILMKAKKIGFNNMKKEYTEKITDLPTTYIMIRKKMIKDYYGAPTELKELEKNIEELFLNKLGVNSF